MFVFRTSGRLQRFFSSTVDNNEILHFSRMNKEWWDLDGPTKPLHAMNQLRVPFIRDGLLTTNLAKLEKEPLRGFKILDVGCGGGILTEPLRKLGAEVTGIDVNSGIIDFAKIHAQQNQLDINYFFTSVEEHREKFHWYYDAVVASEVIEHITEKELFLEACLDCLKPNGSLFLTTMNKTLVCYIAAILIGEYVTEVIPKGTHELDKFISPENLIEILEQMNCSKQQLKGMLYNIMTNNWMWSPLTPISYALHVIKNK